MLQDVAQYVRDNEAGTLKYEINRSLRPGKDGTEDIVMVERWEPQRAMGDHMVDLSIQI
jgi:quinol monooxygenase YgiN